ncbi:MAG: NADAR family protein, partial [Pirellula sp.]
ALGRKVRGFKDEVWVANARRIVTEGNIAKFSQNEGLKSFLLATGTKVLVEASPYDRIWGIGLGAEDPKAKHPTTWQGENLLGFALMDVREATGNS